MVLDPDMLCSLTLAAGAGGVAIAALSGRSVTSSNGADGQRTVRRRLSEAGLAGLDRVARVLTRFGVSANAITLLCLFLAAVAGVLLAFGHFGFAAVAMVLASFGDALDGLVARRSGTASVGGALLDASVDRYEEFFFLTGLAVYLRGSSWQLVVTLFALAGSFMVSYGSAKAEALGAPVPPGAMRRTARAVSLCAGTTLATPFAWLARRWGLPAGVVHLPLLSALALIAVGANVSAIHRLRLLARSGPPKRVTAITEVADASAPRVVRPYASS
jgi:CDP-diacylglycerol--glycerol-3-phosphate 3-phosphatidyltransferase